MPPRLKVLGGGHGGFGICSGQHRCGKGWLGGWSSRARCTSRGEGREARLLGLRFEAEATAGVAARRPAQVLAGWLGFQGRGLGKGAICRSWGEGFGFWCGDLGSAALLIFLRSHMIYIRSLYDHMIIYIMIRG